MSGDELLLYTELSDTRAQETHNNSLFALNLWKSFYCLNVRKPKTSGSKDKWGRQSIVIVKGNVILHRNTVAKPAGFKSRHFRESISAAGAGSSISAFSITQDLVPLNPQLVQSSHLRCREVVLLWQWWRRLKGSSSPFSYCNWHIKPINCRIIKQSSLDQL